MRADAAIVTEPTELELVVAHKGFVWLEIEVTGRAAHGSRPHLGVDAIVKTGPVLVALAELDASLGGARTSAARARLGARLADRGRRRAVELPGALRARRSSAARCRTRRPRTSRPRSTPCSTAAARPIPGSSSSGGRSSPASRSRSTRTRRSVGMRARRARRRRRSGGASYWADRGFIAAAGIPTVLFGPGGEGAHAVEEWVSVADTVHVAQTLVASPSGSAVSACSTRRATRPRCRRRRATRWRSTGRCRATRRRRCATLRRRASWLKDESNRSGCRRSRCSAPRGRSSGRCASGRTIHTLVAASAGNHGRAVAHVAATRGLGCRDLPARARRRRRGARRSRPRAPRSSWSTAPTRTRSRRPPRRRAEPGVRRDRRRRRIRPRRAG